MSRRRYWTLIVSLLGDVLEELWAIPRQTVGWPNSHVRKRGERGTNSDEVLHNRQAYTEGIEETHVARLEGSKL